MKNIDETVSAVFNRIGQYQQKQKRKKQILVRTVTPICCLCILGAIGFAVWNGNQTPEDPQFMIEDALYPGIPDTVEPDQAEVTTPQSANRIIINKVDSVGALRVDYAIEGICLLVDDFVPMTEEEMNAYYGINIFPAVPEDIPAWEDQVHGLYKRDGGTGEVYWDSTILNYDNEDFTRSVNIEIDKGNLPINGCYAFFESIENKSVINGIEVAIGLSDNGYYHTEFIYQDVGFRLIAKGITEEELVSILSSLIV